MRLFLDSCLLGMHKPSVVTCVLAYMGRQETFSSYATVAEIPRRKLCISHLVHEGVPWKCIWSLSPLCSDLEGEACPFSLSVAQWIL